MNPIQLLCAALALVVCLLPGTGAAQTRPTDRDAGVSCSLLFPSASPTPYGFALASLQSLWEARTAVQEASAEITIGQQSNNEVAFITAMMRSTKLSTNHFVCAKRAIAPFASTKSRLVVATAEQQSQIRNAAGYAVQVYEQHIDINRRLNLLLKKGLGQLSTTDFSDQISTLQVQRGQRWADLVPPTAVAIMMLVDERATDENGNFITPTEANPGQTRRLSISKQQRAELVQWMNEHFPELSDGTADDKLSDPAKTAKLYFKLLDGRKASDE